MRSGRHHGARNFGSWSTPLFGRRKREAGTLSGYSRGTATLESRDHRFSICTLNFCLRLMWWWAEIKKKGPPAESRDKAPVRETDRVVLFMISTLVMSMRVTLPSAAPSIGPEISRMPSMTRLSRNGGVTRPAARWRGKAHLDPSERKKLKAMDRRLSAGVCVGGQCGCGHRRPERLVVGPNPRVSTVFAARINGPSTYACNNGEYSNCGKCDDSRAGMWLVCWFPRTIDCIGREGATQSTPLLCWVSKFSVVCKPFYFKSSAVLGPRLPHPPLSVSVDDDGRVRTIEVLSLGRRYHIG